MYILQPKLIFFTFWVSSHMESQRICVSDLIIRRSLVLKLLSKHGSNPLTDRPSYDIERMENYSKAQQKRYFVGTLNSDNKYASNFTLSYKEKEDYDPGHTVTVTVSYEFIFIFTVDTKVLHYSITHTKFYGTLGVNQPRGPKESPMDLSTKTPAEFVINLHDPSNYLDKAVSRQCQLYLVQKQHHHCQYYGFLDSVSQEFHKAILVYLTNCRLFLHVFIVAAVKVRMSKLDFDKWIQLNCH